MHLLLLALAFAPTPEPNPDTFVINSWADVAAFVAVIVPLLAGLGFLTRLWIRSEVGGLRKHVTNDDIGAAQYAREARDHAEAARDAALDARTAALDAKDAANSAEAAAHETGLMLRQVLGRQDE